MRNNGRSLSYQSILCRLLVLALCAIGAGCASAPYPDNWSPVAVGSGECPDISGSYKNAGVASYSTLCVECADPITQLSELLLGKTLEVDHSITIGPLAEEKFQVHIQSDDQTSEARTLSRNNDDFECDDGKIWMSLGGEADVDLVLGVPAIGGEKRKLGLVKTKDGSLVGEDRYLGGGVILVVPVGYSETSYVRWQDANSILDVAERAPVEVAIRSGRNLDRKQLQDVEQCTIYAYTMDERASAKLLVDSSGVADLALTKSDYGQLTLDEGVYSVAVLFSDGSTDDFDVTCKPWTNITGRSWPVRFLQLHRDAAGNPALTLQNSDDAIRNMYARFEVSGRTRIEAPLHARLNFDPDALLADGRCNVYAYTTDENISAKLLIDTSDFAELDLTRSDYGQLTLDEGVHSITVLFGDGYLDDFDVTCVKPQKSIFGRTYSQAHFVLLYHIAGADSEQQYGVVLQGANQGLRHLAD